MLDDGRRRRVRQSDGKRRSGNAVASKFLAKKILIFFLQEKRHCGLKRFSRLWFWTEPTRTKPSPSFVKSLFVVVENLHGADPVAQQITRAWLSRLLQQGDINRLLVPLLTVLLHPATIRSSREPNLFLYSRLYDTRRCRHALECLHAIVAADSASFVSAAALSAIGQQSTVSAAWTLNALLRQHENSVAGQKFDKDVVEASSPVTRNYMDTVLTLLLWFSQSYFRPDLVINGGGDGDEAVRENDVIQIAAVDVCRLIVEHLGCAMSSSSIGVASTSGGYIEALFTICGLRQIVLAALSTSLHLVANADRWRGVVAWIDDVNRTRQVRLIRLVFAVLKLEESQNLCWSFADSAVTFWRDGTWKRSTTTPDAVPILSMCPLAQQPRLLSLLLTGIRESGNSLLRDRWLQLACSSLPCFGVVVSAAALEEIVGTLLDLLLLDASSRSATLSEIAALAHVCIFCLLDLDAVALAKSTTLLDFDSLVGLPPLVDRVVGGAQTSNGNAFRVQLQKTKIICLGMLTKIWNAFVSVWERVVLGANQLRATRSEIKKIVVQLVTFLTTRYDFDVLVAVSRLWKEFGQNVCSRAMI